ncbi:glucooligosaccharide oxidase [Gymnopus androsaceus JB14]|uniref:Glucooligosaccharide oxidase n=1 Tax=Gymnopus androsaceus JB14 TaxID=1447944 RepID=A0A6A4HEG3_9AGAR|nr:glucooligosaccharide oxidase [Gymnopus androsaceus JB14]
MSPLITALFVVGFSFRLVSADLSSGLNGVGVYAVFPGNSNYANASRPFNLRFTLEPAAVAYPTTPDEVSSIVQVGVANNLKLSPIDSSANTAVIETGNRLGDVALALNAAGRALPHGTCAYVGVGGHSAFGGYGLTSRLWGLALDPIFAINAVLANGTIVRVTEDSYPDIFWALLHHSQSPHLIEVNTFSAPSYAIVMEYSWSSVDYELAGRYLYLFQNFSLSGPASALAGEIVLTRGSEEDQVTFALTVAWYGDQDSANSTIQPFLDVMPTPSSIQIVGNGSYIDSVSVLAGTTLNTSEAPDVTDTFYAKSIMTPESEPMTLEACTSFMQYLATEGFTSNTSWFIEIELYGGPNSKIRDIPNNATAFSRRDTLFTFQLYASSSNNLPPYPADGFNFLDGMVNSVTSRMPETWNYGAYTNYLDDELENSAFSGKTLYFNDNYHRLKSIKEQVDPTDTFWFPTSIEE